MPHINSSRVTQYQAQTLTVSLFPENSSIILSQGALGIGYWVLGIGHGALGIGHGETVLLAVAGRLRLARTELGVKS